MFLAEFANHLASLIPQTGKFFPQISLISKF